MGKGPQLGGQDTAVRKANEDLRERVARLEQQVGGGQDVMAVRRENEALRERVEQLERQVGKEQGECQRILEMVLDLARMSRPNSLSRPSSPRAGDTASNAYR